MRKHNGAIFAAVTASAILLAAPALAQIEIEAERQPERQMLTTFVGGQFFDVGGQLGDLGRVYDDRAGIGVRYQYELSDRWGLEGNFLFSPSHIELEDPLAESTIIPATDEILNQEVDVNSYYTMGNLVYDLLQTARWTPFVTAGLGVVTVDPQNAPVKSSLGGNFGGGFLYRAHERIALRLDLRDYLYSPGDLGTDALAPVGAPEEFDEVLHDLSLNFGVSVLF